MSCKDNLSYGTMKTNTESKPQKKERRGRQEKITRKINVICSILVCYLILSLRVCSVTLYYDSTDLIGRKESISQFVMKKCIYIQFIYTRQVFSTKLLNSGRKR